MSYTFMQGKMVGGSAVIWRNHFEEKVQTKENTVLIVLDGLFLGSKPE